MSDDLEFDEDIEGLIADPLTAKEAAAAQRARDGLAVQVPPDEVRGAGNLLAAASAANEVRGNSELSDRLHDAAATLSDRLQEARE